MLLDMSEGGISGIVHCKDGVTCCRGWAGTALGGVPVLLRQFASSTLLRTN